MRQDFGLKELVSAETKHAPQSHKTGAFLGMGWLSSRGTLGIPLMQFGTAVSSWMAVIQRAYSHLYSNVVPTVLTVLEEDSRR